MRELVVVCVCVCMCVCVCVCVCLCNGVARTLKKYAYERDTTVSKSDSLQLCPFSN